jgi:hypothetical protein
MVELLEMLSATSSPFHDGEDLHRTPDDDVGAVAISPSRKISAGQN